VTTLGAFLAWAEEAQRRVEAAEVEIVGPRPGDIVVYGWNDKDGDGIRDPGEIGHTGILSMVPGVKFDSWIAREAEKWVGRGIYGLGKGPRERTKTPFDAQGRADCSKFVTHCCGMPRFEDGIWFNTDGIVRDGKKPGGKFELVAPGKVDLANCYVIHCHGGRPPAVTQTTGASFKRNKAVIVRYLGDPPT
jgi:hypothetical protein